MANAEQLITENLDLWSSTVKAQTSAGRGSNKKQELYGITKLRELILDLAVRGMLVPQYPEDESVATLLTKVASEKDRLAKQKKIKGLKRLAAISTHFKPYKIPASWEWAQLGELSLSSDSGWSPQCDPGTRENKEQWGVLKVSAVSWGEFRSDEHKKLPDEMQPRPECEVKTGDFLLSRANTEDLVARGVVVDQAAPNLMMSDKIVRFTLSSNISKKYINLANGSNFSREYYKQNSSGTSSSMKNVSRETMTKLPIPLPPLDEQHRIVAKVDELMALCDQLEEEQEVNLETHETLVNTLLDALTSASADASQFADSWQSIQDNFDILFTTENSIDQLKNTILQLALMGKLVSQDSEVHISTIEHSEGILAEEMPYAKPLGWKWKRIGDHVNIRGGSQPNKSTFINEPKDGYTRLIQIRDFKSDNFKTYIPTEHANRPFNKEDVMIGRYGPPVFQILRGLEGSYNVALMKADPDLKYITNDYLFYLLQEPRIQKIIIDESERTAGQSGIRLPLLNSIFYGLPPISEQHRIVAKIQALIALCDQLKANLVSAQNIQLDIADVLVKQAIN